MSKQVACPACRRPVPIAPETAAASAEVRCPNCAQRIVLGDERTAVTTEPGLAPVPFGRLSEDDAARRKRRRREALLDDASDVQIGGAAARRYKSASSLAKTTRILLWVNAALIAAILVCDCIQLRNQLALAAGEAAAVPRIQFMDVVGGMISLLYNLVSLGTSVVFLVWFHRAYSNLVPLGAARLRQSPGLALAFWFIPFANFVMPALAVQDMWRNSDPDPQRSAADVRPSGLVRAWWGMWLLANLLSSALVVYSLSIVFRQLDQQMKHGGPPIDPNDVAALTFFAILVLSVTLLAAFLCAAVVGRIDARISARAAALFGTGEFDPDSDDDSDEDSDRRADEF
jgi:DNA-directed RNA polymerase subunit RPC12/RpoP